MGRRLDLRLRPAAEGRSEVDGERRRAEFRTQQAQVRALGERRRDHAVEFSSEGKKSDPRTLERSEPSGCLARFVPVAEHAVHSVAEEDECEFVGVWKGTTKNKLKMEIHVAEVGHDGQATGALLMDPQGPIDAGVRHRTRRADADRA